MAAEALLEAVREKSLSLVRNEFATNTGLKKKIEYLSSNFEMIKKVLEDAEEQQITSDPIKDWLQQLKDAVYMLDDILDECSMKFNQHGCLSSFKPSNIMFRHRLNNRLAKITRRFDQIAEERNKFYLREGITLLKRQWQVLEWRETGPVIPITQIYGRKDDKEKIVDFLLNQARCSDFLSVYPIIGLGGIGKTTLTQMVYNDERVSHDFNVKIWVCASENFSIKRILCSIIESLTREKYDAFNLDVIERKVQELLQKERYLLVLDDVWKANHELELGLSQDKWSKLKSVLSCGSKGTSILVSTRDEDVAAIMGTSQAHYLVGLSEDQYWLLFKQYAFFGPDKENRAELITIGKEILNKCGGSPLAARALGALLHSRNEEREWVAVKESRLWTLLSENSILTPLWLNYLHLTPTSKQCFALCAMFPKDTKIMKEDIIHIWMANGFISSGDYLEVEDVGNMVWNELCQKSFIEEIKVDDSSANISFKMHDLVHDLAQSVMGQECLILDSETMTDMSKSTRHVSFHVAPPKSYDEVLKEVKSLRTLCQLELDGQGNDFIFPLTPYLRVIRTSSLNLPPLKNFIHLRYLELYGYSMVKFDSPFINTLLKSISTLKKLEILKLKHFSNLVCLPKHFTSLQNLRHLVIESCYSLSNMFPDIRKLSSLRTLSLYIVGSETGHSLAELHDLKIGGKLSLEGLENVDSLSDARDANLIGKKDLKNLSFSWYRRDFQDLRLSWYRSGETESPTINVEQVLEGLQPHSNLKRLRIHQYEGLRFPPWLTMDMINLVVLELHGCRNVLQLPSLITLPSLRKLKIQDMDNLRYLDDDEKVNYWAYSSLEELSLSGLPKLEQLLKVEKCDMFPLLSDLNICYCPELVLQPIPSLKRLQLYVCNNKVLKSVSSFIALTSLEISCGDIHLTSFPEGMMRNLTSLETLVIYNFPRLKKITNELLCLYALKRLEIILCEELESLPEEGWKSLRYLSTLKFYLCGGLRSLPEGVRHLNSLEVMEICNCPALEERCKKGTGEDWDKIQHIPKLIVGSMVED